MSTGKGGKNRTVRYELLEMMPNTDSAAALVQACSELPCTLRGSAPPRRSVGTCAAGANTTDLHPDVVVSAGEALHSDTAVWVVVSPSWPRDSAADAADVSTAVATDIAAAAAALEAAVVDGAVSAVAALDIFVVGDPVAGCGSTIVVALGRASIVAALATSSVFGPGAAAAPMGSGKRVG